MAEQPRVNPFLLVFGAGQLALAVFAASRALSYLDAPERPLAAGYWRAVAIGLALAAFGILNIVGGMPFRKDTARPERLGVRLSTNVGAAATVRGLLMLGIALSLPILPLLMMTFRMVQTGSEFVLLGVGFSLVCVLLGPIILYLALQQLFVRVRLGQMVAEIGAEPLHPGQSTPLWLCYQPGQCPPQQITARLVCNYSRPTRPAPHRRSPTPRETYERKVLHTAPIATYRITALGSMPAWEYQTEIRLPPDAQPSTAPGVEPTVEWAIEVDVVVAGAPDAQYVFPFSVTLLASILDRFEDLDEAEDMV